MIIAQLTISGYGVGTSLSKYVQHAIDAIKDSGLKHYNSPMSTCVEAETLDELFALVKDADARMAAAGLKRISIDMKIDHRLDKDASMDKKLASLDL